MRRRRPRHARSPRSTSPSAASASTRAAVVGCRPARRRPADVPRRRPGRRARRARRGRRGRPAAVAGRAPGARASATRWHLVGGRRPAARAAGRGHRRAVAARPRPARRCSSAGPTRPTASASPAPTSSRSASRRRSTAAQRAALETAAPRAAPSSRARSTGVAGRGLATRSAGCSGCSTRSPLVAVLVAGLGIVNTLTMNVVERVREIGVLRAAGMTRRQVWRMVVVEAGDPRARRRAPRVVDGPRRGGRRAWSASPAGRAASPLEVPWPPLGAALRPRGRGLDARGLVSGAARGPTVDRPGGPVRVTGRRRAGRGGRRLDSRR